MSHQRFSCALDKVFSSQDSYMHTCRIGCNLELKWYFHPSFSFIFVCSKLRNRLKRSLLYIVTRLKDLLRLPYVNHTSLRRRCYQFSCFSGELGKHDRAFLALHVHFALAFASPVLQATTMQTGSSRRCYHKNRSPDKTVTMHYRQEEVIPETTVFFTVSLSTFVAIYHSRCCGVDGRWPKRCISDCGFHWSKFIATGLIGGASVHYFFFLIRHEVFSPGLKIKTC